MRCPKYERMMERSQDARNPPHSEEILQALDQKIDEDLKYILNLMDFKIRSQYDESHEGEMTTKAVMQSLCGALERVVEMMEEWLKWQ